MVDLSVIESELKAFIERNKGKSKEVDARLMAIEQSLVARGGPGLPFAEKSLGQSVIDSEGFAALRKGAKSSGRIAVPNLLPEVKTVLSGTWSAPPDYRPVMVMPPQPVLPVRALMPTIMTQSNMIEFPKGIQFHEQRGLSAYGRYG